MLALTVLAALGGAQVPSAPGGLQTDVVVFEDLYYGLAASGGCGGPDELQCLDLYLPGVVAPDAPTFVWVHGGGFLGGDKGRPRVQAICRAVALTGVPALAINYTLGSCPPSASEAAFPSAALDVKLALAWIRSAGRDFGLPTCILLGGSSSGGLLASLCATAWDVEELDPLAPGSHAPDLYRPNLVVAFSVLPDLQARGCLGASIDPSCAEGNAEGACGSCSPVVDGCCSSVLATPPSYAVGGQSLACWLGAPWASDCARFPNAQSALNVWMPSEPYLNASPAHWLGFSDDGAFQTGLPDPPIVLVQRKCDLLGSPADGAAFRAAAAAQGGIVEVVDYVDACLACQHGASEPFRSASLALDVWSQPAQWFAAFSEPAGGYLSCP